VVGFGLSALSDDAEAVAGDCFIEACLVNVAKVARADLPLSKLNTVYSVAGSSP
jgi:hypothetical protein